MHKDSFKNLSNLEELNLGHNSIEEIHDEQFIYLGNLKNLILYNNKFYSLKETYFVGLSKVEELDLRLNKLTSVKENDFKRLVSMRILLINRQEAHLSFDQTCLVYLKSLKHLFIDSSINLKALIFLENIQISLHEDYLNLLHLRQLFNNDFLFGKGCDLYLNNFA